jgi:hypothetical protein
LNKSNLLLKNILQNAQVLQLLTMNIKTEIIHKSYSEYLVGSLGWKALSSNLKGEASALSGVCIMALIKVENVSWEEISVINLSCYRI